MPFYFFDSSDGADLLHDIEGRNLPNLDAARREAIEDAQEIISEAVFRTGNINLGKIVVREAVNGSPVLTVAFKDVIEGLRPEAHFTTAFRPQAL